MTQGVKRTKKSSEPIETKRWHSGLFTFIEALRPLQWLKNLLLFAGIFFSRNLLSPSLLLKSAAAFGLFCLLSSSVYLINDVVDVKNDRFHPTKCRRPLASGRLSVATAVLMAVVLGLIGVIGALCLDRVFGVIALAYYLMMMLYNFSLKKIATVEVFVIAAGFVVRAVAGAVVIHVAISPWLIICTTFLALFLVLCKRRYELLSLVDVAESHRKSLGKYSAGLLDQFTAITTTSVIICYALYTMSEHTIKEFGTTNLVYSFPLVVLAIFRYLYLVHQKQLGGSPERLLLNDRPLRGIIAIWGVLVFLIIYWPKS